MKASIKQFISGSLIFVSCFTTQAQIVLESTKVTKEISMEIPVDFIPMSKADLINKYVSSRTPIAMYTSADREIDLGINENSSTWAASDLHILQDFYKSNILNLFTEVNFITEEIRKIGDRSFVVFEFVSTISDEDSTFGDDRPGVSKYNYIIYTIRNNKVLLFNFNCPARMRSEWEDAAEKIMESVRLKD